MAQEVEVHLRVKWRAPQTEEERRRVALAWEILGRWLWEWYEERARALTAAEQGGEALTAVREMRAVVEAG